MSKDCYPGGKNAAGVYHAIINQMPKHRVYIEPFLGSGAILRYKRPADTQWACEITPDVYQAFDGGDQYGRPARLVDSFGHPEQRIFASRENPDLWVHRVDALKFLREFSFQGERDHYLIYCDPPYLREMRSTNARIYSKDFSGWFEHEELLALIQLLNANVMISGYDHPLYNGRLEGWRKVTYTGVTRGGARTEVLWMNFPEPDELHDYRYLGNGYRDRENIKRQQKRWTDKLRSMPLQKRYALMAAIEEVRGHHPTALLPVPAALGENVGTIAGDNIPGSNTFQFAGEVELSAKTPATIAGNGEARATTGLAKKPRVRKPLQSEIAAEYLVDHYWQEDEIEGALVSSDPVRYLIGRVAERGGGDGRFSWRTVGQRVIVSIVRKDLGGAVMQFTMELRTLAKRVLDRNAAGAPLEAEFNWPPKNTAKDLPALNAGSSAEAVTA